MFQPLERVFEEFLRPGIAVSESISELVGDDKGGIYFFDKDIRLFRGQAPASGTPA